MATPLSAHVKKGKFPFLERSLPQYSMNKRTPPKEGSASSEKKQRFLEEASLKLPLQRYRRKYRAPSKGFRTPFEDSLSKRRRYMAYMHHLTSTTDPR
jgi:hypothetical protein